MTWPEVVFYDVAIICFVVCFVAVLIWHLNSK
jgi:hypothetical protein